MEVFVSLGRRRLLLRPAMEELSMNGASVPAEDLARRGRTNDPVVDLRPDRGPAFVTLLLQLGDPLGKNLHGGVSMTGDGDRYQSCDALIVHALPLAERVGLYLLMPLTQLLSAISRAR